ncbi:MAG: hypothetical protein Q9201_003668 [Fulgogasparrea decipioides]
MAKDQLRQHQPADRPAASAGASHHVPDPSDISPVHKHALALSSPVSADSKTSTHPLTSPLSSRYPPNVLESAEPGPSTTDPTQAGQRGSRERQLTHEATLRRLNGLEPQPHRGTDSGSTASTQPVLVRKYSKDSPTAGNSEPSSRMKQKRQSRGNQGSSKLPPLESFSFQDILASIDPDVSASIDKIAEICGRSKMSLADEYSSHLPPQADFSISSLQEHNSQIPIPRLEPVEEVASTHEDAVQNLQSARSRAARLSIAGESTRTTEDLLSAPVTATSTAASHTHSTVAQEDVKCSGTQGSYVPQFLAWLRSAQDHPTRSSQVSRRESGAANALQKILGSHAEPMMP